MFSNTKYYLRWCLIIINSQEFENNKGNIYICIGASAGGLESLKSFFQNIPKNIRATFFVVQHHSSKVASLLDQILARETSLTVKVVKDGMLTEPNHLYIIPPGSFVSIYHGRVYFINHRVNGSKLPIDYFFESLAVDQGQKVIGIIMSGTGNDGSLGMKRIKENNGIVIIQSKETAQFPDMPLNVAKTTSVDYTLSPKDMSSKILEIIEKRMMNFKEKYFTSGELFPVDLMKISYLIRLFSGIDFVHYKEEMVARRVKIRMSLLNIQKISEYISILDESLEERINLLNSFTGASKKFFSDIVFYDVMKEKILPFINYSKSRLRVWSIGCSSGQEVYSITILILEYLEQNNINIELKVFATDIDESELNSAREGIYSKEEFHQIDDKIINKYFIPLKNGFRVSKKVREMIVFAKHDLLKDPPFSNIDLINCRNVLINYNQKAQSNILYTFHYALRAEGFLAIGKSESLGKMGIGFTEIEEDLKIFSYKNSELSVMHSDLTVYNSFTLESQNKKNKIEKSGISNNQGLVHKLLESQLNSGVLIDSSYKILQIFNDVYPYLRISKGRFSDNFFANISSELALIISKSLKDLETQEIKLIESKVIEMTEYEDFLLKINKIAYESEFYYLITFNPIEKYSEDSQRITSDFSSVKFKDILKERISILEGQLRDAQDKVNHNKKNEKKEIQDLEKYNHQLILSKENLEFINEELYSINDKYETALKEQFQTTEDLKILLGSLPIEGIYLNSDLKITAMTKDVTKYTHLIDKDIGRSIEHLNVNRNYPTIIQDLKEVLRTSKRIDRVVKNKSNKLIFRIESYPKETSKGLIIIIINIDNLLI